MLTYREKWRYPFPVDARGVPITPLRLRVSCLIPVRFSRWYPAPFAYGPRGGGMKVTPLDHEGKPYEYHRPLRRGESFTMGTHGEHYERHRETWWEWRGRVLRHRRSVRVGKMLPHNGARWYPAEAA